MTTKVTIVRSASIACGNIMIGSDGITRVKARDDYVLDESDIEEMNRVMLEISPRPLLVLSEASEGVTLTFAAQKLAGQSGKITNVRAVAIVTPDSFRQRVASVLLQVISVFNRNYEIRNFPTNEEALTWLQKQKDKEDLSVSA